MRERTPVQLVVGIAGALFLLFWPFVLGTRVPLLGLVDLGFHELGHMLAIPLGQVIHFLAGSATQVLVPLGLATYFWISQRDRLAAGLLLAWAASSFQDVSVYVADAPFQRIQLIGGQHDWAFLLGRWRLIDHADTIASFTWVVGAAVGVFGLWILVQPFVAGMLDSRRREQVEQRFGRASVRQPRNPL